MTRWFVGLGLLAALGSAACGSSNGGASNGGATGPNGTIALASVSPANGATGVAASSAITLRFSAGMASGMDQFMDLHMGDLSGPTVAMSCTWSGDRETMTCTPQSPLIPHTNYAIHIGGGMMGANGMMVDYSQAQAMGGQWIMGGMMSGTHGGGMGWTMMGGDWRNTNGSYGMMFTFTTA